MWYVRHETISLGIFRCLYCISLYNILGLMPFIYVIIMKNYVICLGIIMPLFYVKNIHPNDYFDTERKPNRLSRRHGLCSLWGRNWRFVIHVRSSLRNVNIPTTSKLNAHLPRIQINLWAVRWMYMNSQFSLHKEHNPSKRK